MSFTPIHLIFMYFLDQHIIINPQFHFNLDVFNLIQQIKWTGIGGSQRVIYFI
jgi:hypothetical protein